jgi:hypothetical protein
MKLSTRISRKFRKVHPVLWLNSILAHPIFIISVNALITAFFIKAHFSPDKAVAGEHIDLGMSWWTMVMDQVIISAGWLITKRQSLADKKILENQAEIIRLIKGEE